MARKPMLAATLRVHANPYAALDARGYPAGQTRYDPIAGKRGQVHFVGAEVERVLVPDEDLPPGADNARRMRRTPGQGEAGFRKPIYNFKVTHWLGVIEIADTEYHRRRIRNGELLAADEATARAAGLLVAPPPPRRKKGSKGDVKEEPQAPAFVPPAAALKAAREKAIADWKALYPDVPLPIEEWPVFTIPDANEKPSDASGTTTSTAAPAADPGA